MKRVPSPDVPTWPLAIVALFITGLMFRGNLTLLAPQGLDFSTKFYALAIACLFGFAFWYVMKLNIERGAPLAAEGYPLAVVAAITSLLTFAAVSGTVCFVAMAAPQIGFEQDHGNGERVKAAIATTNARALAVAALLPQITSAKDDANDRAISEERRGSLSTRVSVKGKPQPVTDFLKLSRGRFASMETGIESGNARRMELIRGLTVLAGEYDTALSDTRKDANARRTQLQGIDGKARAMLQELTESLPIGALRALAAELRTSAGAPVIIDDTTGDQATALENQKGRMRMHAANLEKALEVIPAASPPLPPYTPSAPLVAAFEHFGAVWVYALLAYGLEGVAGFVWMHAYLQHKRRIEAANARDEEDEEPRPSANGRGRRSPGAGP